MNELCIDASVAVKLVLKGEPYRNKARRLLKDCIVNNVTFIAPPFFASETDTAQIRRLNPTERQRLLTLIPDFGGISSVP